MKRKIKSYGEIPLDVEAINETNRLHLSVIENYMLWPDDDLTRQKAINSSFIEYITPHVKSMSESELIIYAEVAQQSFPINYMQEEAKILFLEDILLGLCLENAYQICSKERAKV